MAFGSKDTKGIYKYGEDDTKTTFSELLNTGMDSVSDAARAFSGTAAQRAAFLDAAPGSIWQDTNGTKQLWRWLDGSWNLLNVSIAEGGTGATTLAGAQDSLRVGLVNIIPSSISTNAGSSSFNATTGEVTFTGNTTLTLNGVFSSDFTNYRIVFEVNSSSAADIFMQYKNSGGTLASGYLFRQIYLTASTITGNTATGQTSTAFGRIDATSGNYIVADLVNVGNTKVKKYFSSSIDQQVLRLDAGNNTSATAYTDIVFTAPVTLTSGTVKVYGYN